MSAWNTVDEWPLPMHRPFFHRKRTVLSLVDSDTEVVAVDDDDR